MSTPSNGEGLYAETVDFAYGSHAAVRGVTLGVRPGEMLALAGPNGSGKTTLLKLLSGARRPHAGKVRLDGKDLARLPARERARRLGVVSQHVDLRLAFTVEDVVHMGRAPYIGLLGAARARDRQAVRDALRATQLEDYPHRPFDELSGGEQQRVMIAMALAQQPNYLLLDEPTVHLDLGHQHALLELLCVLRAERGLGIVAVLHDLNLAMLYFQRLALLDRGRLVAEGGAAAITMEAGNLAIFGAPLDLVSHPQTGVPQVLMRRGHDRPVR